MYEDQQFVRLIANTYDAALDAALWPDVLVDIADFAGGRFAGLLAKDLMKKRVDANFHAGVDPYYMKLYAETYSKLGPLAISPFCDVGQVVSIPDLVSYDEFCRGAFYLDWARPQGWVDATFVALERSEFSCAYLGVARDEARGMVDDEMRRRMALVMPHVRRAVLIGKTIDFKRAEAATFADILAGLNTGLLLVSANGELVHTNPAGKDILNTGDFLRLAGGRLSAGDAHVDQILRDTLAAAGNGDAEVGAKGIAIPFAAHDGEHYVVHVLPLTAGARRHAGAAYTAAAALFVRKATMVCPHAEAIRKTYNLTPAELRVMRAIVDIGGVPEVAAALGVAETTIKTHLSRLFEKTGAARQADLVKLVAGFSTPLAD